MMMELMDCDLHRVIQSKQPLSEKHHKCFVKQILEAIKAMHAIGVFHRDLKPGNILVSKDCQVRITDFGLARFMDEPTRSGQNDVSPMTEYVVTRWYRCPELLLSPNRPYSEAIDLWSIGCILAELLRRKPLFPGKNHANQVQLIFEVLGYDGTEDLGFPVTGEAAAFLDKRCRFRKQPLKKFIPDASDQALNLVEELLTVNPATRPSAITAINHPFLADAEILNDYTKNYLQRPTVDYFNFEHEKFTVAELKDMIDQEVYSAAANAYRFKNSNNLSNYNSFSNSPPPSNVYTGKSNTNTPTTTAETSSAANTSYYQPAAHHPLTSQQSQQNMTRPDENEGPASQLATQMKNTRIVTKDNPFSRNGPSNNSTSNNRIPLRQQSNENVDSEETKQQLQKFLKSDASENNNGKVVGPSGSILTAVRNEMGPPGTRGRKSVPKTPSPQKMDLILQKDYQNKQRLVNAQQQPQGGYDSARSNGSGVSSAASTANAGNRLSRSTFPNGDADSSASGKRVNGIGYNDADTTNANNNKRPVNKIMGMPFPSLTSGIKSFTRGGSNAASNASSSNGSSKAVLSNSALAGDNYTGYGNHPVTINRSGAIQHTGSSIIQNSGSDYYQSH